MQEGPGGPCSRACSGKAIIILEEQKGWSHRSEKEGGKWKEKSNLRSDIFLTVYHSLQVGRHPLSPLLSAWTTSAFESAPSLLLDHDHLLQPARSPRTLSSSHLLDGAQKIARS